MNITKNDTLAKGILLLSLFLLITAKSSEGQAVKPDPPRTAPGLDTMTRQTLPNADESSVSARLTINEIDKFIPGRRMNEILKEVHWVGNFEMASLQEGGKIVSILSFDICPEKTGRYSKTYLAIFVNDNFVKFIDMDLSETPLPILVGTFPHIQSATKLPAIPIASIKKSMQDLENIEPPPTDPALLLAFEQARAKNADGLRRMVKENALLRDQFNAARLKIGMSKVEVSETLKARPLESGILKNGFFEIYGSNKPACPDPSRSYYNILAFFNDDRLTGIYSGYLSPDLDRSPNADDEKEQTFIGLPSTKLKAKDSQK